MKYNHGGPSTRSYDSCFYKLVASADADAKYKYVNVEVTKNSNVNTYLYGGLERS